MEQSHGADAWRVAAHVVAATDLAGTRQAIVDATAEVVACDLATLAEVGPGRALVITHPAGGPSVEVPGAGIIGLAEEHPVYRHLRTTGDPRPTRLSDHVDPVAFHASVLYRDLLAPRGIEFQAAFGLPARPPVVVAVVVSRGRRDFTDDELAHLEHARKVLGPAFRHAVHVHTLHRLVDAMAAGAPRLYATVGPEGLHAGDDAARALLARWDDDALHTDGVRAWFDRERLAPASARREPYCLAGVDGALFLRCVGEAGEARVELDERIVHPDALGVAGLSERERDVLSLVVQHTSTKAIAARLGSRPATVKKHIENAYRRLGVHDRNTAVRAVLGLLDDDALTPRPS